MPQGSRIGPTEFPSYTAPLFTIAEKHNICIHMYADDTQLYVSFPVKDCQVAIKKLEDCVSDMRIWMRDNHLKLNDNKTEFMIIGKPHLVKKIQGPRSIKIGGSTIEAATCVKNIGAMLDSGLEMRNQVNYIAKSSYMHLRNIGHIRPHISDVTSATLVHAFISSKLDNLNSLLIGIPECVLKKLQLIQNNAARIVARKRRCEHITPVLSELHWLPVKYRLRFKIALLTFKALNGLAPEYISSLVSRYVPHRPGLRSEHLDFLRMKIPNLKQTGGRAFSVCAPVIWNALPLTLRRCANINTFKTKLKTHLFKEAFQ